MFDNLRDDATPSFYEEEDTLLPEEYEKEPVSKAPKRKASGKFLGMTSMQRFILAVMLLIAVCTLGSMCLLLTGKIGLL
ncbi:MAG: hypothetical protein AB8I58_09845 [Anaerolineales bacterium]|jgi:hypothetical protein